MSESLTRADIEKTRAHAERRARVCRACSGNGWTWEPEPQRVVGDEEYRKDCAHCDRKGIIPDPDTVLMRLCDTALAAEQALGEVTKERDRLRALLSVALDYWRIRSASGFVEPMRDDEHHDWKRCHDAALASPRVEPALRPEQEIPRVQPLNPFSGVSAPIGRPSPEEVERRVVEQIAMWLWEQSEQNRTIIRDAGLMQDIAEEIRAGAWRSSTPDTEAP